MDNSTCTIYFSWNICTINFQTHIFIYINSFSNTIYVSWTVYIYTLIYTHFSLSEILSINIKLVTSASRKSTTLTPIPPTKYNLKPRIFDKVNKYKKTFKEGGKKANWIRTSGCVVSSLGFLFSLTETRLGAKEPGNASGSRQKQPQQKSALCKEGQGKGQPSKTENFRLIQPNPTSFPSTSARAKWGALDFYPH